MCQALPRNQEKLSIGWEYLSLKVSKQLLVTIHKQLQVMNRYYFQITNSYYSLVGTIIQWLETTETTKTKRQDHLSVSGLKQVISDVSDNYQ